MEGRMREKTITRLALTPPNHHMPFLLSQSNIVSSACQFQIQQPQNSYQIQLDNGLVLHDLFRSENAFMQVEFGIFRA